MYERFVQLLQEKNLTAYRVSKDTGVTQTTLSDWKTGRATPRTTTLQKIADYFGVSLDWLTGKSRYRNNKEVKDYDWGISDEYFDSPFDFAGLLTPLREKQDVSLPEIGKVIGATGEQMEKIEEGYTPITYEEAEALCSYLGTDVSQVYFDNEMYTEYVPEEYHDNVREWERIKKIADEERFEETEYTSNNIENPDIRMIARAGKKMTPEQAENLRKYAQFMFPEAFKDD